MDMERKFKKVISDFDLTNSLLTQEKQKNATMGSTVRKIEGKLDELKNQNNKIRLEN